MSSTSIVFWPDGKKPELTEFDKGLFALRWPTDCLFELHMTKEDVLNLYELLTQEDQATWRTKDATPTG